MTVELMEGFETVDTLSDLRARGSNISSSTIGNMFPIDARYPSGTAMARAGGNQRFIDKPIGTLRDMGGGAFLSFSALLSSWNVMGNMPTTAAQTPYGWIHGIAAAGINNSFPSDSVAHSGIVHQLSNPSGNNIYYPQEMWYDSDRDQLIGRYQYQTTSYWSTVNAATNAYQGQFATSGTTSQSSNLYLHAGRPSILAVGGATAVVRQVGSSTWSSVSLSTGSWSWAHHTPYGYMAIAFVARTLVSTTSPNANTGWGNQQAIVLPSAITSIAANAAGSKVIVTNNTGNLYVVDTSTQTLTEASVTVQTPVIPVPSALQLFYMSGNFYAFEINNVQANAGTPTRYWTAAADEAGTTLVWTQHVLESSKYLGGINGITESPGLTGQPSYLIITHSGGTAAFGTDGEFVPFVGGPVSLNNNDVTGLFNRWATQTVRFGINTSYNIDTTDPQAPLVRWYRYWGIAGGGIVGATTALIDGSVADTPIIPQSSWSNIELAVTSQGNEMYQVSVTQDSVPVNSTQFSYTPLTPHNVSTGGVTVGRQVVTDDGTVYTQLSNATSGSGVLRSFNWAASEQAWSPVNIYSLAVVAVSRLVTDGSVVLAFGQTGGGTASSTIFRVDGASPSIVAAPLAGSAGWTCAATDRKGTWMAGSSISSTTPTIWISRNLGSNWTAIDLPPVATSSLVSEVIYGEDDTWCVFAGNYVYQTKDSGVTWSEGILISGATSPTTGVVAGSPQSGGIFSGCYGRGKFWYVTSSTRLQIISVNVGETGPVLEDVFNLFASTVTMTAKSVAVTDQHIFVTTTSTTATLTTYYTTAGHSAEIAGDNWPALPNGNGRTDTATVNNRVIMMSGITAAAGSVWYLESMLDMPLLVRTQANNWTAVDDVVVTNMQSPNLGPVGETRIYVVPTDVDVGTPEWTRVPEDLPSNAAAAAAYPLSSSTSRVEAANPGQRDVYGTSEYEYPTGLKPVAMSFEGNFGRLFTNTPVVELELQVDGQAATTGEVAINTPLGQTVYVSRVLDRSPAGNTAWNRTNIPNTELTLTKVS